jgi:hypothetical protein
MVWSGLDTRSPSSLSLQLPDPHVIFTAAGPDLSFRLLTDGEVECILWLITVTAGIDIEGSTFVLVYRHTDTVTEGSIQVKASAEPILNLLIT